MLRRTYTGVSTLAITLKGVDLNAHPAILCTGDLICQSKKCTKPPVGTACGNTRCPLSAFCKEDEAGTCADRATLDQPCSDSVSDGQPLCLIGLRCANGKCTEYRGVGSPCSDTVSGVCQILNCAP